jgi:hypothetical protein
MPTLAPQVRIGFSLPVHADIRELRAALARDTGIEPGQLLLAEMDTLGFQRTFTDGEPLANIGAECPLYGIEMPRRPSLAGEPANGSEEEDGDGGGAFILLTWVNVFKEGAAIEARFGSPYTIQVPYPSILPVPYYYIVRCLRYWVPVFFLSIG